MNNKLTREDFEGYLSQHLLGMKVGEMKRLQDELILEWLEKEISKMKPSKEQNAKQKLHERQEKRV